MTDRLEAMADINWTGNKSHLCFGGTEAGGWCGGIDECSQKGLLLPLFFEGTWPREARAVLYFVALLYSFLGVSIVADVFMCAIEKITSKTKLIHIAGDSDEGPEAIEVSVWNGTVANLTLMALGSSAPEILLSIIEIVGNGFEAGELGPGTIVGSAAFNLLVISAVCVVGIPKGDTRRIDMIVVFGITAFFSIFAYIWLLIILKVSSPNVVDMWEAIITFLFFPILVVLAYCADKGWLDFLKCQKKSGGPETSEKQRQIELGSFQPGETEEMLRTKDYFKNGQLDKEGLVKFIKDVKKNTKLSDEDAAILAASKIVDSKPHSRMWYRIGAVRNMTGGRKTQPATKMNEKLKEVYDAINENPEAPNITWPDEGEQKSVIEFHSSTAAVLESIGTYTFSLVRHGRTDNTVKVRVETIDGSAKEQEDYEPLNEILTFEPNELEKEIGVKIVDDNQWEPDEEFFVKLTLIPGKESEDVRLGRTSIMEITILNDDEPGTIQFEKRGILVKESCGEAEVSVVRQNGADGEISVKYRTIDGSAVNNKDYTGGEGLVKFKHGETHQFIKIPIIDDYQFERDENFEIELFEPEGGAKLGKINRTAVTITNDDEFNSVLNRMLLMTNANLDSMKVHHETWAQQLKDAMNVNGGDVENATAGDYVMHFLTFGFKIIFALIPPAGLAGGWPCFFVSLGMIGILTAIVGDLAGIFGCLVGLKDSVTAITFVALGTSLPDTFASKSAAVAERTADNAIGNVTGSNSVNVFLGLGLPWMIASIYHAVKGQTFNVDAGALGFSVMLYTITAIVCVLLLMVRRSLGVFGNAELGGPAGPKYASGVILCILWFSYVLFSALQAYGHIEAPF